MFNTIIKKLNYLIMRSRENNKEPEKVVIGPINPSLEQSKAKIKEHLGEGSDIKIHEFTFGEKEQHQAMLLFIDGMANPTIISENILKPLINIKGQEVKTTTQLTLEKISRQILCSGETEECSDYDEAIYAAVNGEVILFVEGMDKAVSIDAKGWEKRSITEPQTEAVVRGPREGFTENLRTNTSMIRRKIRNPSLKIENMKIGRKTRTDVSIVYIGGVAKAELVETVKQRLKKLQVDAILDAGYIEEYIDERPLNIFSTIGYTEKPDVAAAKVLEGRVAILVDGSPFALTAPMFFVEAFQMSEDYYTRSVYASITRIMRIIGYLIAVYAVPIFIALTTYHQELIPTKLLMSLINAKEGTPFPVFFETLIMVIAFEILREAGLRLPKSIGQAISIVGALIIGEAAVAAGLVGTAVVITVALAAVAGYTVPTQAESISMLRILMMFLAAFFGGFGITMGFLMFRVLLAKIKSFGMPYLGMTDPNSNMQDSFFRYPLWLMAKRPINLVGNDKTRLKPFYQAEEAKENENEN